MNGYCQIPGCEKPVEGRTGLCASHNKARRKELPDTQPRSGIKKSTPSRKKELEQFKIEQEIFCRGKRCAVFPMMKAEEVHHIKGRNGALLMDKRYWLAVSRKGHVKIEMNPLWAKKEGFSISRLTDEPAPMDRYLPEPPTI